MIIILLSFHIEVILWTRMKYFRNSWPSRPLHQVTSEITKDMKSEAISEKQLCEKINTLYLFCRYFMFSYNQT